MLPTLTTWGEALANRQACQGKEQPRHEDVKMPGDEGHVPTGDVQLAINQAIINMLDPAVSSESLTLRVDKIRAAKELMG